MKEHLVIDNIVNSRSSLLIYNNEARFITTYRAQLDHDMIRLVHTSDEWEAESESEAQGALRSSVNQKEESEAESQA